MLFSSLFFLSIFLPLVIFVYYSIQPSLRNSFLLCVSLLFYAWGEPRYLAIMLSVILLSYCSGIALQYMNKKRAVLMCSILFMLAILFYFKYSTFVLSHINSLYFILEPSDIVMPIGISFFIFQAISYVIDVYRKRVRTERDIYTLGLYIAFFPQLIAGPIIQYHTIYEQIHNRGGGVEPLLQGLRRFSFGLGKKVIIANTLGSTADAIFALHTKSLSVSVAWLGAICYSLQLYFDFSGYSDMAIGLGRIFGFRFPENFRYPYISKSISEFWRRWHITLGAWFREYLYIPLGGNRISKGRTYCNIFIVFLATGLWHGANWTFLIWGIWHGILIIIERICCIEQYTRWYYVILRHCYVLIAFTLGWVMFRADNIRYGMRYIRTMLGLRINKDVGYNIWYYLDTKTSIMIVLGIILSTGVMQFLNDESQHTNAIRTFGINLLSLAILVLSLFLICASTYNPFIYFRF